MSPKRERMLFPVFFSFSLSEIDAEINNNDKPCPYSSSLMSNFSDNPHFWITATVCLKSTSAK